MTVFDRQLTGFRFVEIMVGDTLQAIAARELGDASRWTEIAALNLLVPPYIVAPTDQPLAGVVAHGGQVLVPAPNPIISTEIDPERVFESDLSLTRGRLTVTNGDFSVVAGRDNLRQAIKHRIDTERGEMLFYPEYGSLVKRLIGAVNGPAAGLLAAQYARSAVINDPRVLQITQSVAEVVGDTISVKLEFQPVTGRKIEIEVTT